MVKTEFDHQLHLVTSYLLTPKALGFIRLFIALYTLVGLVFILVWEGTKTRDLESFFSYFTNLGYIGICAYYWASGTQTVSYVMNLKEGKEGYALQTWPRVFRYLHVLLLSTVVTFPILVTLVYWSLLLSRDTFATPFSAWSNVSKHALNSAYALFEILFTNVAPMPWIDLPATLAFLGGYLGVAYITHATQGIYTYSFLDPKKEGSKLALYIVGIALGQCIIFLTVSGVIRLRRLLTSSTTPLSKIKVSVSR